jgi:hypothetical protein
MNNIQKALLYIGIIPAVIAFWSTLGTMVYWFDDIQEMRMLVLTVDPTTGLSPIEQHRINMSHLDTLWLERMED